MVKTAFERRMELADRAGEYGRRVYGAYGDRSEVGCSIYLAELALREAEQVSSGCDLSPDPRSEAGVPYFPLKMGSQ
ncbi:MAG: hypothetical protein Q7S80_01700 [bacterium]|nr:hypothetical protein [bacterium]